MAMMNYITFRKNCASKFDVFILKVVAVSIILVLIFLELLANHNY
jgi:hypothetical protein